MPFITLLRKSLVTFCSVLALGGCADIPWKRAFYEGQRQSAHQCRAARNPSAPTCAALPEHADYESQRTRARSASPVTP